MDLKSIDNLGIDRVLKRGTGKIIEENKHAILVYDTISDAYLLACDNAKNGQPLLERNINDDCGLLLVANSELGKAAFEQFGFDGKLECFQVAYFGRTPEFNTDVKVRIADKGDLPFLIANYRNISKSEMETVVERKNVLIGYHNNKIIGFIGEHLEGSIGMLYVLPEFRRKGFGAALEKTMIAKTIEKGYVPFGQIAKDNYKSLQLQQKLGMAQSDNTIFWMWKS